MHFAFEAESTQLRCFQRNNSKGTWMIYNLICDYIDSFLYFLERGHSLEEIGYEEDTCPYEHSLLH